MFVLPCGRFWGAEVRGRERARGRGREALVASDGLNQLRRQLKPEISLLALSQGAPVYAPITTFDAGSAVNSPSGVPAAWSGGFHLL